MNVVINFRFHRMREFLQLAVDLLGSQEGLCAMVVIRWLDSKILVGRLVS